MNKDSAIKLCNGQCLLVAGVNLFQSASHFCNHEPNSLSVALKILQLCLYGIRDLETLPEGGKVIEEYLPKLKRSIQSWISQKNMIGDDSFGYKMQKASDEKQVML